MCKPASIRLTGLLLALWLVGSSSIFAQSPLEIAAPPDDTITATMPGCRGMLDLPPADVITQDCPDTLAWKVIIIPEIIGIDPDTLFTNGGKANFRLGVNEVIYMATDTCGDTDMDTMNVTVFDSIPPVARCVPLRTVSLDGSGMAFVPAFVFDNQSEEFCFKFFKARRLLADTLCVDPNNPTNGFNDEVKFCCTDIGDTIEVVFKVYDVNPGPGVVPSDTLNDRADTCIARILVLDKAPPMLVCPPDITIECGDHIDFDTLGLPDVTDNCDTVSFEFFIEKDIDQCGVGEFRRVIVGTDAGGLTDTCIQTITVVNNNPFDGLDTNQLRWPEPFVTIYDCIKVPDTSVTGVPIILEDQCAMATSSFKDEVFEFSRGACSKVIRTWKVLDWCQYDPRMDSRCIPANGCYTFEQVIKVIDTVAPVITRPRDTTVAYLQPGCDSMMVTLDSATTDRCFPEEEIILRVLIDFGRDGTIDRTIENGNASGIYPVGAHWVIYEATDDCGNTSLDTLDITIKDRVLPTPIAKTGLSTTVIDMGGGNIMVSVSAEMLNASSYDNCTSSEDLIFSFSPDTSDTERIYDCDSIGSRMVRLWVTDECGNQDFAELFVIIDDNNGVCPTTSNITISGMIQRTDGMRMPDVEVSIEVDNNVYKAMSQSDGSYVMPAMPKNKTYTIIPDKDDHADNGLNVRDIIMLQRHLLGKDLLDEIGQYIAADVDRSGHLSTRDITNMRKVILGKSTGFPHDLEWTFIPGSYQFKNPNDPLDDVWPEKFVASNLTDPLTLDWDAYKLGDIDQSYQFSGNEIRSFEKMPVEFRYNEEGGVALVLLEEAWVEGLQIQLELEGVSTNQYRLVSALENFTESNYHWRDEKEVQVLWVYQGAPVWMPDGSTLIEIPEISIEDAIRLKLKSKTATNLLITTDSEYELQTQDGQMFKAGLEVRAYPNPFSSEINLDVYTDQSGATDIVVRNVLGAEVYRSRFFMDQGWNKITLDSQVFPEQGFYWVSTQNGVNNYELKVIRGL